MFHSVLKPECKAQYFISYSCTAVWNAEFPHVTAVSGVIIPWTMYDGNMYIKHRASDRQSGAMWSPCYLTRTFWLGIWLACHLFSTKNYLNHWWLSFNHTQQTDISENLPTLTIFHWWNYTEDGVCNFATIVSMGGELIIIVIQNATIFMRSKMVWFWQSIQQQNDISK